MEDAAYQVTIVGIRPLIMHNGRLQDPLDEHAKALKAAAKKRDKSEHEHAEVRRIEFLGGMYYEDKLGPYIPPDNLLAMIIEGARKRKLGKEAEALVDVPAPEDGSPGYALEYEGPRDLKSMSSNPKFCWTRGAKQNRKGIMRTRPRFPSGWRCRFVVEVMGGALSKAQLHDALADAGIYRGLGDWRPRYGKFEVQKVTERKD